MKRKPLILSSDDARWMASLARSGSDRIGELEGALPSLISFALSAPTNAAAEAARDHAVQRARKALYPNMRRWDFPLNPGRTP